MCSTRWPRRSVAGVPPAAGSVITERTGSQPLAPAIAEPAACVRFAPTRPTRVVGLNLLPGDAAAGVFHPETFMLDNGMQVVVVDNHRAPVVAHWVWYKVGTADSPPGKSGLPHFLEHLMFKGTGEIPPGEFSQDRGARTAATTTP